MGIMKHEYEQHEVPASVKAEHKELYEELEEATKVRGEVGEAARAVEEILRPHFIKEEEYALPPLAFLPHLAEEKAGPQVLDVISMTDRLKVDLPQMLREHKQIVWALNRLAAAAKKSKKTEQLRFSEKLVLHAQNEEEILYPAAILVGEYLKLKFPRYRDCN